MSGVPTSGQLQPFFVIERISPTQHVAKYRDEQGVWHECPVDRLERLTITTDGNYNIGLSERVGGAS